MSPRETVGSPAVTRAIELLGAIAERGSLTITELATHLGLQKSSIADTASTLHGDGMLVRASDGKYTLGPTLERLVPTAVGEERIYDLFDEAISHEQGDLTFSLHALFGAEATCIAVRLGSNPLNSTPRAGQRSAGSDSAVVASILATAPPTALFEMMNAYASHQNLDPSLIPKAAGEPTADAEKIRTEETPSGGLVVAAGVPSTEERPLFCAVAAHFRVEDRDTLGERARSAVERVAVAIARPR